MNNINNLPSPSLNPLPQETVKKEENSSQQSLKRAASKALEEAQSTQPEQKKHKFESQQTSEASSIALEILAPKDEISPLKTKELEAQNLLYRMAEGEKGIQPDALIQLFQDILLFDPRCTEKDPKLATLLHKIVLKAADLYIEQGDVSTAFKILSDAAQKVRFSSPHPLHHLEQAIFKQIQEMQKANLSEDLGAHFSHFGGGSLNEGLLHGVIRNINGKNSLCMDFKLTPFARDHMEKMIKLIIGHKKEFLAQLPANFCKEVNVSIKPFVFLGKDPQTNVFSEAQGRIPEDDCSYAYALEVDFVGLGSISTGYEGPVGKDLVERWGCLYKQVNIQMELNTNHSSSSLEQLHTMLTLLGCGEVLGLQRPDDAERLKIIQLFRAYYPKESYNIETQKEFYEWSPSRLRTEIERVAPAMKERLEKDLPKMEEIEIYPGQKVWKTEISKEMVANGAWGLMIGRGVAGDSLANVTKRLTSILTQGPICTQDRYQSGLFIQGWSSDMDLSTGGGDQVFLRLVTNTGYPSDFIGHMQVLYDIQVVNQGAYGYTQDYFGVKNPANFQFDKYENRQNLVDLTKTLTPPSITISNNEIAVKRRIDPKFIRAIVVKTQKEKEFVIEQLKQSGKDSINGKTLDQFVQVSNHKGHIFRKEMWNEK